MNPMNGLQPQLPSSGQRANNYRELHRQVLKRDSGRCQTCGSMQNLQAHHLKFHSQAGTDEEQNLITLCAECHKQPNSSIQTN